MKRSASKEMLEQLPLERRLLLADICEMYYLDGLSQRDIGRKVGLTSSMISRLISEAHDRGMVEIHINRPLESDTELEKALQEKFDLDAVHVIRVREDEEFLLKYLGDAGAHVLKQYLHESQVIGVTWGTTLSAVIDAFSINHPISTKLVELTGALGSRSSQYEAHGIITRLANKLGAEYHFLNAPFICESKETAQALIKDRIISQPLVMAKNADLALMGVGSLDLEKATMLKSGYMSRTIIEYLSRSGAIGNVCGLYYDIHGDPDCSDFCERIISISKKDLFTIPIRLGVVGGEDKPEPIIGAVRGGYINVLVTDNITAQAVLDHCLRITSLA